MCLKVFSEYDYMHLCFPFLLPLKEAWEIQDFLSFCGQNHRKNLHAQHTKPDLSMYCFLPSIIFLMSSGVYTSQNRNSNSLVLKKKSDVFSIVTADISLLLVLGPVALEKEERFTPQWEQHRPRKR